MATHTEAAQVRPPRAASRPDARGRPWDVAVVAGPAALAIALCLYELTTRSLWLDEAATVAIASQHSSALWHAITHDGGNMLGYYALLHVLVGWFGDGAAVIRLPSVVAAGGCAAAVSLLALRVFDRRVALAAGVLTAVSLPLVFWGQDARGYAAMAALVAGSFCAFAEVVEGPPRRAPWIAYVLLTTLSVYASYVAVFALGAQLLALAWRRQAWRRALSAMAVCVVCWIPLMVLAASRGSGQLFWIPRPDVKADKQVILALTSAGFEPNFRPTAVAAALAIATVALLLAAAARTVRGRGAPWGALLALAWLVVPVALMWLWSLIGQPIFTARNALVSLPAVALLLGWVITSGRLAWPALAVLGVLVALRAVALAPSYGTSPENWRAATAYVTAAARPGDCYAFYPLDGRMPFAYYTRAPVQPYVERYVTPRVPSTCPRVWLIASHQGLPSGTAASRAHYARYVALRSALARAYPHHSTRAFGYASIIWVELLTR